MKSFCTAERSRWSTGPAKRGEGKGQVSGAAAEVESVLGVRYALARPAGRGRRLRGDAPRFRTGMRSSRGSTSHRRAAPPAPGTTPPGTSRVAVGRAAQRQRRGGRCTHRRSSRTSKEVPATTSGCGSGIRSLACTRSSSRRAARPKTEPTATIASERRSLASMRADATASFARSTRLFRASVTGSSLSSAERRDCLVDGCLDQFEWRNDVARAGGRAYRVPVVVARQRARASDCSC